MLSVASPAPYFYVFHIPGELRFAVSLAVIYAYGMTTIQVVT